MKGYENFRFSMFLTVGCVNKMFGEGGDPDREFEYYSKYTKFEKVYLECFRGEATPLDTLLRAKKYFEDREIRTATALMPSYSAQFDCSARMLCFTNPEVRKLFSEYISSMGAYFDEIMIDDSLSTDCTCERCRTAKGDRSWQEFRTELMAQFCKECIVEPAKKVNPNVKLTLKYPTWQEAYQVLGYNTKDQPPVFDNIYTGTETRHTSYAVFRNPRYTSYSILRYLSSLPPRNNRGGWFDSIQCANNMNYFCEQAEMTLLAAPEEMTLFCWSLNYDTMYVPALGYFCDRTDRFLGKLGKPVGVPVYLPHHARGEDYLCDYLGMCGVPTDPTVLFPEKACTVILTAASVYDKDLISKVKAHLEKGGNVVMTSGCLEKLQDAGAEEFTAMRVTGRSQSAKEFGGFDWSWASDCAYYNADHDISMPVIDWATNENEMFAVQMRRDYPNILLARSWYGRGKLWVLNVPDTMSDLYRIPAPVMDYVRKYLSADMPVWLEGQNEIAVFNRDNNTVAVKSFLEHGSVAYLHVKGRSETLTSLVTGAVYKPYTVVKRAKTMFTDPGNLTLPVEEEMVETVYRVVVEPLTLDAFRWE